MKWIPTQVRLAIDICSYCYEKSDNINQVVVVVILTQDVKRCRSTRCPPINVRTFSYEKSDNINQVVVVVMLTQDVKRCGSTRRPPINVRAVLN